MAADLKVALTHTNGIQLSPKCVCVFSVPCVGGSNVCVLFSSTGILTS